MLAFFVVIVASLTIVAVLFSQFTTRMVEDNTYSQLNRFAVAVAEGALQFDANDGSFRTFDTENLESDSSLLRMQDINFTVYNANRDVVYPTSSHGTTVKIQDSEWNNLTNHRIIQKRSGDTADGRTLDVMKPFFDRNGHLIAVVVTRESISTVADNLVMLRKNLLVAFVISILVVVMLSFIFSRIIVNRLRTIQLVTRRVAEGDYTSHFDVHGKDEIADLANDVNSMTNSLAE